MLTGWIGTTDYDWYDQLRRQAVLEEVNFWQPSGRRFHAVEPGAPFFFKLKSPRNAIGGFGIYTRCDVLPDWLAWECFGERNGAPHELAFRARIDAYRRKNGIAVE